MSTGYEPNIEGAITVLVDILTANAFTLTRQPYEPNYRGLVDAIIDLKEGFPIFAPTRVGFDATAFESVADGDAVYMRVVDGLVGKASAASGTIENATVIGFTDSAASPGDIVKVLVTGLKTMPFSVDEGVIYFLSETTPGAITTTPPSVAGQAVTRLGEGAPSDNFSIQIEPPILLR